MARRLVLRLTGRVGGPGYCSSHAVLSDTEPILNKERSSVLLEQKLGCASAMQDCELWLQEVLIAQAATRLNGCKQ